MTSSPNGANGLLALGMNVPQVQTLIELPPSLPGLASWKPRTQQPPDGSNAVTKSVSMIGISVLGTFSFAGPRICKKMLLIELMFTTGKSPPVHGGPLPNKQVQSPLLKNSTCT